MLAVPLTPALDAQQAAAPGACRVSGKAASTATPLPGVSIVLSAQGSVKAVTSTDTDGTYHLTIPAGPYKLTAELTGFGTIERDVTLDGTPCARTIDLPLALALAQRAAAAPVPATGGRGAAASAMPLGQPQRGAPAGQRFETLTAQTQATAAVGLEVNPPESDTAARLLLPPGFSTEGPTQAVAINGNMASLDRGMMNDRMGAIGRGEFDPATGEFGEGFGPGHRAAGSAGPTASGAAAAVDATAAPAVDAAAAADSCSAGAAAASAPTACRAITRSADRRSTVRRTNCAPARPRSRSRTTARASASRSAAPSRSRGCSTRRGPRTSRRATAAAAAATCSISMRPFPRRRCARGICPP